MGNQEYGTGLITSYKQLVSDQLGIDADRIDVIMGDTDRTPAGLTGGSRAIAVGGAALYEAGRTIIDKGTKLAAHLLEVVGAGRRLRRWRIQRARHRPALDLLEVAKAARDPAKLPAGMEPGLDTTHHRVPPAQTFPNGCHIVEVEIDPEHRRGRHRALHRRRRFRPHHQSAAARRPGAWRDRAGHRPGAARARGLRSRERAAAGGLVHGLRHAARRRPPSFAFSTHNVPSTSNPLGVKGAGEAGAVGAPPAMINAIVDALHHRAGVRHIDMPATPCRVWEMLNRSAA